MVESLNIENQNGWNNEVATRRESMRAFLRAKLGQEGGSGYDSLTELHISGGGKTIMQEIREGKAFPTEVGVYHEGGVIRKIHVHYLGPTANLDIYLDGRALEDFLHSER